MSQFTPAGSSGTTVVATGGGATQGQIDNVAIPAAAVEQSYTFPTNTVGFTLKLRGYASDLLLSYATGTSGTIYLTIPRGCFHAVHGLSLTASMDIYFQTSAASQILEIEYLTA